jgi:hypothetical protein
MLKREQSDQKLLGRSLSEMKMKVFKTIQRGVVGNTVTWAKCMVKKVAGHQANTPEGQDQALQAATDWQ